MRGIVFDIKHFAIHDGPGIRQTIFLKGCPLSCWWCHNPESRSLDIFSYLKKETIDGVSSFSESIIGKEYSVEEIMLEINKDVIFFEESSGGVTLSGGEPLLQFDFVLELLSSCQKLDIHTCVDTTGNISSDKIVRVASFTDLFLYDLKHLDNNQHIKHTGVSNKQILNNLKILDELGKDIQIRFPLIPTINDDESNIYLMMDFLSKLKYKYQIEILPYHKIGKHKYERFGYTYKMNNISEPDTEHVLVIANIFRNAGFEVVMGG